MSVTFQLFITTIVTAEATNIHEDISSNNHTMQFLFKNDSSNNGNNTEENDQDEGPSS